ncbi:MAG: phosphatase domain-containing protein [Kineosporiaceae bacterium]
MGTHPAGRLEDVWNAAWGAVFRRRGWRPVIVPYQGYGRSGDEGFVRVLARVLLVPGQEPRVNRRASAAALASVGASVGARARSLRDWSARKGSARAPSGRAGTVRTAPPGLPDRRGWRAFFTLPAAHVPVTVSVGDVEHPVRADRSGIVDVRLPAPEQAPGWQQVTLRIAAPDEHTVDAVTARVFVVAPDQTFGLVSDIDDTVIRTLLPRPLLAAYNTFVLRETSRSPVAGMSELYRRLLAPHPGAPTVYVSTGAWNTAAMLRRFLARHGYPEGPLLLTDWGPTNTGWFRSGADHKRACLRALAADLPSVRWVLVGDDGQRDPSLYAEFARERPDRVRVIAIRQLTVTEQMLAHGSATNRIGEHYGPARSVVPEVRAPDGTSLAAALTGLDVS